MTNVGNVVLAGLRQEMDDLIKDRIARSLVSGGGCKCRKCGIGWSTSGNG